MAGLFGPLGWCRPRRGAIGPAVGVLGAVRLLGTLIGVRALGPVGLLGPFRSVGHVAAGRVGIGHPRLCRCWLRGSGLRLGPVGLLRTVGRVGVAAGERRPPGTGQRAIRVRLVVVGVLGLLRGLGSLGVHQWLGALSALGRLGILRQLGVLGPVSIISHSSGRASAVGRLWSFRAARLGRVIELGTGIRTVGLTGAVAAAGTSADHRWSTGTWGGWAGSEEGRTARAARPEEGTGRALRPECRRLDSRRGHPGQTLGINRRLGARGRGGARCGSRYARDWPGLGLRHPVPGFGEQGRISGGRADRGWGDSWCRRCCVETADPGHLALGPSEQ